jgi:hypothetical protein
MIELGLEYVLITILINNIVVVDIILVYIYIND